LGETQKVKDLKPELRACVNVGLQIYFSDLEFKRREIINP